MCLQEYQTDLRQQPFEDQFHQECLRSMERSGIERGFTPGVALHRPKDISSPLEKEGEKLQKLWIVSSRNTTASVSKAYVPLKNARYP